MPDCQADERAIQFECEGDALLGILHPAHGETGILIVVGGPQYRVGSHRQFVRLAREFSAAGHPTLRFDVRGMGDSLGEPRSFEHTGADIGAAIDALKQWMPKVRHVVLLGLCDGASAALLYLHARSDERVGGLCLLNPWVRSATTLATARVKHYYARRFVSRDFWTKLLRGGVSRGAPLELLQQLRNARQRPACSATFQDRMRQGWASFKGSTLLVLCKDDLTAQEFIEASRQDAAWLAVLGNGRVERVDLADADHTFSSVDSHRRLVGHVVNWIRRLAPTASVVT